MSTIIYYALLFTIWYLPTVVLAAVILWIMGSMMKDLTVTPRNAFIVAIIGTIIGGIAQCGILFLLVFFEYIFSLHMIYNIIWALSAAFAAFLVYIPLVKKFFKVDTGQAFMVAIVAAIITLLMAFVGDFLVRFVFRDVLIAIHNSLLP